MTDDADAIEAAWTADNYKAQGEAYDALAATVALLTAPHENHTGATCLSGSSDCCWRCATLEGLLDAVRETNSLERDRARYPASGGNFPEAPPARQITLPEWCSRVRYVEVIPIPLKQYRHEYCLTCGHRDTRLPALTFDENMRRYYTADMIENIVKKD